MTVVQRAKLVIALAVLTFAPLAGANAADLKIGFIGTLSGPLAAMGQDQLDGFLLGLSERGERLGGQPVRVIIEDDQLKPDVGVQAVQKLISEDKVPIVTGVTYTNVAMAIVPKLTDAGVFVIGSSSGPAAFAGKSCSPYFFSTSWQTGSMAQALGQYAQDKGYKRIFALGPNYAGWDDLLQGFKRNYKSDLIEELHTPMGQVDYSSELARISVENPDAVYAHYAGGMGINFMKQYVQAGLNKTYPLLTVASIDGLSLPALKELAIGAISAQMWSPDLDNPENKKFVEHFEQKYNRIPSNHAAQGYDAAALLDSAISKVNGDLSDKKAFRSALRAADFRSVRGDFSFNTNQFPIENFYLLQVEHDAQGRVSLVNRGVLLKDHKDPFAVDCHNMAE
jgi:branched-chain amino acid transport system substrate-binding protein